MRRYLIDRVQIGVQIRFDTNLHHDLHQRLQFAAPMSSARTASTPIRIQGNSRRTLLAALIRPGKTNDRKTSNYEIVPSLAVLCAENDAPIARIVQRRLPDNDQQVAVYQRNDRHRSLSSGVRPFRNFLDLQQNPQSIHRVDVLLNFCLPFHLFSAQNDLRIRFRQRVMHNTVCMNSGLFRFFSRFPIQNSGEKQHLNRNLNRDLN